MDRGDLKVLLETEWIEKRSENSFICPVCGATIQKSDISLHKEWHKEFVSHVEEQSKGE